MYWVILEINLRYGRNIVYLASAQLCYSQSQFLRKAGFFHAATVVDQTSCMPHRLRNKILGQYFQFNHMFSSPCEFTYLDWALAAYQCCYITHLSLDRIQYGIF